MAFDDRFNDDPPDGAPDGHASDDGDERLSEGYGPGHRPQGDQTPHTVIVGTMRECQLTVRRLDGDPRIPSRYRCLESVLNGRVIGRQLIWPPIARAIEDVGLFARPVKLALLVREMPPGLQGRLVALLPRADIQRMVERAGELVERETAEPWASEGPDLGCAEDPFRRNPEMSLDDDIAEGAADESNQEGDVGAGHSADGATPAAEDGARARPGANRRTLGIGALLLGHIVRFHADRLYPGSLDEEAADLLEGVLDGTLRDAEEQAIDAFLAKL